MANRVVIVESPTKARTLKKLLGREYQVLASVGHIIDLPKNSLGVDVDKGFVPEYGPIDGKEKVIDDLKEAASNAEQVLLATDPDREGEAISWHICNLLNLDTESPRRVLIPEFTSSVVKSAVANPVTLDMDKVNSQQARRILDRLVGYKISPLLWDRLQKGLSAGRVQSVALKLICDRDKEIQAFKAEEYWTLEIDLAKADDEKLTLKAELKKKNGKELKVQDQKTMDSVVAEIGGLPFQVASVDKSQKSQKPNAPFITSTLQQAASQLFNFQSKRTMRVAQQLYEGIDIGERGTQGLITYMRTDSVRVSPQAQEDIRKVLSDRYDASYLPDKPPQYKGRGKVQDAHEAIRPADVTLAPEEAKEFLSAEQYKLYSLIWVRFAASQMKPAVYHNTRIDVSAGDYTFRSNGRQEIFPGFLRVQRDLKVGAKKAAENDLPPLEKGDDMKLLDQHPEQHFTQPPPYFTEAALVKTLEENGIGRPSTYATIISTLIDRKYVDRVEKNFRSTELGTLVDELLESNFDGIVNVKFTAGMEEQLDEVEKGKHEWQKVLGDFYGDFKTMLEKAHETMRNIRKEVEETDVLCDKCEQHKMIIRRGRYGKFMACPGYPKCKNTKQLKEDGSAQAAEPELLDETCDKCQKQMQLKKGRFGMFKACSNYPDCKFTRPVTLGITCPEEECKGGELVARNSKRGKTFYGCTRYPECKFTSWVKPVGEDCPDCGKYMVEKRTRKGLEAVICSSKECGYARKVEAEGEAGAEE